MLGKTSLGKTKRLHFRQNNVQAKQRLGKTTLGKQR
jgi:hypothetical protein